MVNTQCKRFDGRKNNSSNVSKLVVHALHSNFAKASLEIWNVMLKRNIFIEGKILTSSKSRGIHIKKSKQMKCPFSQ